MTEKIIKEMILKLFKYGIVPVLKVLYHMIKAFIKNNPYIMIGITIGFFFGSWLGSFFNWIPIIGAIINFISTLCFTIVGGVMIYKLKEGKK